MADCKRVATRSKGPNFEGVTFESIVSLHKTRFERKTRFTEATFGGLCFFGKAFGIDVSFNEATFMRPPSIPEGDRIWFTNTTVAENPDGLNLEEIGMTLMDDEQRKAFFKDFPQHRPASTREQDHPFIWPEG